MMKTKPESEGESRSLEVVKSESVSAFASLTAFESAQRMAKLLSESALIPDTFRGKIADCVIALELANRIGASPLAVMQNLYIVHGKPAWSSQFLIACVNACGRFSPLRYVLGGTGDDYGCLAWANDKSNNERLEGPKVTLSMAKAEGWFSKNGSKWKTMPELMLRYRAATLFARTYAPELTMGIHCEEEVIDIGPVVTETRMPQFAPAGNGRQIAPTVSEQPEESTPQTDFGRFMAATGVSFEDFRGWMVSTGRDADAGSWADWAQMPEHWVATLRKDAAGLAKCVTLYGKAEAK